eukprot:scaffold53208_cov37-Cyclotella_meneghiniana.AAC.7
MAMRLIRRSVGYGRADFRFMRRRFVVKVAHENTLDTTMTRLGVSMRKNRAVLYPIQSIEREGIPP